MDKNRKDELLKKYADRTLTPAEEQEFWEMAAGDDHMSLLDDDELYLSETIDAPEDIEHSLASIKENVAAKISFGKRKPLKILYKIAASIAAILFLFAGIKGFQYYNFIQDTKTLITIEAHVGETLKVMLPDSSVVTVSSGSVFSYPKAFGNTERRVYLRAGEAFFQVTKNPEKPFSVESGELQTTALGTSFTVAYNPVYRWGKVNLYTGKVSVGPTHTEISRLTVFLTPGHSYEYAAGKEILGSFDVILDNPIEKGLVFEGASFSDAIHRIESWYKVTIRFNASNTRKFTVNGDFNGKTVEEILNALAFIHQLKFTKTDSLTYTFMKKPQEN